MKSHRRENKDSTDKFAIPSELLEGPWGDERPITREIYSKRPPVEMKYGPRSYRPVLVCLTGPLKGQRRALMQSEIVIGRSATADWRLNDSTASRYHLRITYENVSDPHQMPRCFVEDLESLNGTELNGETILGPTPLRERDRLCVGSTIVGYFIRDEAELSHDESLYESATRDSLTGLDNRRHLIAHLRHHLARAERQSIFLSFLLLDLDRFKKINDEFGHEAGDRALRHIAELLREGLRESDLTARWGGEEFALCLPDTGSEDAMALGERIRRSIQDADFEIRGERFHLTASIGGTTYRAGDTTDSLFQRADRMLYLAKNRGRNRIEFTDDTEVS